MTSHAQAGRPALRGPRTVADVGLSIDFLAQLALKILHFEGELTGTALAARLGLPFPALEPVIDFMKAQQYVALSGGALGIASLLYRITDAGRARARVSLEQSHYVGPAPVPLEQYRTYMQAFRASSRTLVGRAEVREAFSHLVIRPHILDQLGPAINAGHSMFIYGPPGNGKTVMSLAVPRLLHGEIDIPYAVEVAGHVIQFFDPVNHTPVPRAHPDSLDLGDGTDGRWVRCRRPLLTAGGELTLDQLELSHSPLTGIYQAPLQAMANGGVLVIDDFGRQRAAPRDLLNRWIVPLESGVDVLTLKTGLKLGFPFVTMVVFATNIRPADLVDEAFLRRIHYKVFAESPTPDEYHQIFERVCAEHGLAYRAEVVDWLLTGYLGPRRIELRRCQPRDLVDHVRSLAEYLGEAPELRVDLLDAACAAYFVDNAGPTPTGG